MRKYRKTRGIHNVKGRIGWILLFICALLFGVTVLFQSKVGPNIDEVSKLKARTVLVKMINETMTENLSSEAMKGNLFYIEKGENGDIQMVQSNTPLISNLISEFSTVLQKKYDRNRPCVIKIAYGTLIGSKVLSQTGLKMKLKIYPLAVANCEFETDFQSEGINQTKYRIYLVVKSDVRVLQPFSSTNFSVKNKVLLAETVIIGEVPDSYVKVPEDEILNVTKE